MSNRTGFSEAYVAALLLFWGNWWIAACPLPAASWRKRTLVHEADDRSYVPRIRRLGVGSLTLNLPFILLEASGHYGRLAALLTSMHARRMIMPGNALARQVLNHAERRSRARAEGMAVEPEQLAEEIFDDHSRKCAMCVRRQQ